MFSFLKNFANTDKNPSQSSEKNSSFDYLKNSDHYFDSACTTLRPKQVIEASVNYYQKFGSCGGRVKYKWGQTVDKLVAKCRSDLLDLCGKSAKDYTVAFCLNTTHGINTILHQINTKKLGISQIITSEIEHNSVFLPSMTFATKNDVKRTVLTRDELGNLIYEEKNLQNSIVIVNTQSNIDGRELMNAKEIGENVHKNGGILLLDACQTFGHNPEFLKDVDFDAAFGSGHKMYGPSVGFIIIKKDLVKKLDCFLIGGSTVSDVKLDSYNLVENDDEIYARIEPGLQDYAAIIGLLEAISWRQSFLKNHSDLANKTDQNTSSEENSNSQTKELHAIISNQNLNFEQKLAHYLHAKLAKIPEITLINRNPSPVVSFYSDKIDSHKLATLLGEMGIMGRSGYHCCHYYLKEKLKLPPLFRVSLGLYNTPEQIDFLITNLEKIVKNW